MPTKMKPLKAARVKRGLTHQDVAAAIGAKDICTALRIENYRARPSNAAAVVLYHLYDKDVSVADIFGLPTLREAKRELGVR